MGYRVAKHDNMFSRFDTIPACDGRTDGQTDVKPIAITCFSIADARKNRYRNDKVMSVNKRVPGLMKHGVYINYHIMVIKDSQIKCKYAKCHFVSEEHTDQFNYRKSMLF